MTESPAQVAIVTGAAGGIGRAVAGLLLSLPETSGSIVNLASISGLDGGYVAR